jgi:hypothetical protein
MSVQTPVAFDAEEADVETVSSRGMGGMMFSFSGQRWSSSGRIVRAILFLPLLLVSACASFDGQPRAVIGPAIEIPPDYAVARALETYDAQPDEAALTRYRNRVIGIYMIAADGNFLEFRRLLSREMKGSNFGLGLGFVALTSAATIAAERTANILAAGASGLAGAQGRLSTEVYFEKTLPALFAGMDANRTRVRTNIVARMANGDSYTLTEAFSDLARYEAAASIDSAIEAITASATADARTQQREFERVVGLGPVVNDRATRIALRDLTSAIDELALDAGRAADVARISDHLGLPTNVDVQTQATAINFNLATRAAQDPASLDTFVQEMQAKGVDSTQ